MLWLLLYRVGIHTIVMGGLIVLGMTHTNRGLIPASECLPEPLIGVCESEEALRVTLAHLLNQASSFAKPT